MKHLLFISAFFMLVLAVKGQQTSNANSDNGYSGHIDIIVSSNINKQYFQYNLKQQCLAPDQNPDKTGDNSTSTLSINVPVSEFKCANRLVYRDFLSLLKADRYPDLKIGIPENSILQLNKNNSPILKNVTITVAGVSKQYDINSVTGINSGDDQVLKGTAKIRLTDLKIDPPVKLFGLIRVKNEITINFELCLKYPGIQYAKSAF